MSFRYPDKVSLANLPTRVEFLERLTRSIDGPRLYIKRDDETGCDLSGNKVRKLEFLLAEALESESDIILTCGGVQSNHCRATVLAARRLGMDTSLFLRGKKPSAPSGNLLLDFLGGADVRFVTPREYADRSELLEEEADRLRSTGRRPYIIPEGGSNALGTLGYVAFMEELVWQAGSSPSGTGSGSVDDQEEEGRPKPSPQRTVRFPWDHIVCATGSGGTLAGLILGARLFDLPVAIWGVNVCDCADYFRDKVIEIAEEFRHRLRTDWSGDAETEYRLSDVASEVRILEGYKGTAYARTYPEELNLIRDLARRDGLLLDPVYTGKAFYGLLEEASRGRFGRNGERVLFVHTGGLYSLFAEYRSQLTQRPARARRVKAG